MDPIATQDHTSINHKSKATEIPTFINLCSDEENSSDNRCNDSKNIDGEMCYAITDSDENDDVLVIEEPNIGTHHAHRMIPYNEYNIETSNNSNNRSVLPFVQKRRKLCGVTIALRPSKRNDVNKSIFCISSAMKENIDKDMSKNVSNPEELNDDNPTFNCYEARCDKEVDPRSTLLKILQEYEAQIKDAWQRRNEKVNKQTIVTIDDSSDESSSSTNEELCSNSSDASIDNESQAKRLRLSINDKPCVEHNISTASVATSPEKQNIHEDDRNSSTQSSDSISRKLITSFEEDIDGMLTKIHCELIEETKSTKTVPVNYNNDCQMTSMDCDTCALCSSKPKDLTNHYVRRHKTESYISRLPWFKLNNMINGTNYVDVIECVYGKEWQNRCNVLCPFCNIIVTERFHNLYEHFSTHTGEYAYGCENCNFTKPFVGDIKNHQNQSKFCQTSDVKILYRYPLMAEVIRLYYCYVCNFVQLNEANIAKHLRDHHTDEENLPTNIRNCILASIPSHSK